MEMNDEQGQEWWKMSETETAAGYETGFGPWQQMSPITSEPTNDVDFSLYRAEYSSDLIVLQNGHENEIKLLAYRMDDLEYNRMEYYLWHLVHYTRQLYSIFIWY